LILFNNFLTGFTYFQIFRKFQNPYPPGYGVCTIAFPSWARYRQGQMNGKRKTTNLGVFSQKEAVSRRKKRIPNHTM
jgi:hypothetical protein